MYNPKTPDFHTWLARRWSAGEELSEVTLALERHYSLEPLLRERLLDAYQNNLYEEERRLPDEGVRRSRPHDRRLRVRRANGEQQV